MRVPLIAALALLSAGCSSGTAPGQDTNRSDAGTRSAPANETAAAIPAPSAPERPALAATARRCGWLANPTPGNWWLTDSQGEWVLATQGSEQAAGMDEMPDMSTAGWVETNGSYGHGCACMTITSDGEGKVLRVADPKPRPLAVCRADRKLPAPD